MTALFFTSGHAEWLERLPEFGQDIVPVVKKKHLARYAGLSPLYTVEDLSSVDSILAVGQRLAVRHRASRVLTLTEAAMVPVAALRESLALPGQPVAEALRFTNKYLMKRCLRMAGIPVAPFELVAPSAATTPRVPMPPPLIVKPVAGAGSVGVCQVLDGAGWDSWSRQHADGGIFLAEPLVEMDSELHADGVIIDGEVRFCCVSQYTNPLFESCGSIVGSYVLPEADPRTARARDLHGEVVAALGLTSGVTHMELFDTARGLVVSEIASRPAGGGIVPAVAHATGVDLVQAALALQLGAPVKLPPARRRTSLAGWLGLPARRGKVSELTPAGELTRIPGVVDVTSHYEVGDVIVGQTTSTFHASTLLFEVDDVSELRAFQRSVAERYRLVVT
ncbi:MAG TPA: hypothetical protein VFQ44_24100 [Streptosporangiaceae bacterium]|nr:hypothetical protein [Streptosporangiaceae bacterium]